MSNLGMSGDASGPGSPGPVSSHGWLHPCLPVEGITWHYSLSQIASLSAELLKCMPAAALLAGLLSLMIIWSVLLLSHVFESCWELCPRRKRFHMTTACWRAHLSCAGLTPRRTRARCGCIG